MICPVRLPLAVAGLFENWLERHMPDRKDKVLNHIRSMRCGKLNDARFGHRMSGEGIFAEQIGQIFDVACRRAGLNKGHIELTTDEFRVPDDQPGLFE
jgi:DNA repair photolyase